MSDEYNSRLLYLLEGHATQRELTDALEEMAESGSEVFLYPVLAKYRKSKNTSISHYFLSVLGSINSPRALSQLTEIFNAGDTKRGDKLWILPFFSKNGQFDDASIKFSLEQLEQLQKTGTMDDEDSDEFELPGILSFLKSAQKLGECKELLESILFDPSQRRQIRKIVFFYWIRENPDTKFKHLVDNYDLIKDDDFDIILAEEVKKWKGSKVKTLIELIKAKGYTRAKEILDKSKKEEEQASVQRKEIQYPNIEVVKEIIALRTKTNLLTQEHKKLGFEIFVNSETLVAQQEAVTSRESLISKCIDLREIIQNITAEAKSHNLDLEAAKKIIPDITKETLNRNLNGLHLTLASKGLSISTDLFGLKNLNQAVSLIAAHPTQTKSLIKILTALELMELYKIGNWQDIHTNLLTLYKNSVNLLLKSLS